MGRPFAHLGGSESLTFDNPPPPSCFEARKDGPVEMCGPPPTPPHPANPTHHSAQPPTTPASAETLPAPPPALRRPPCPWPGGSARGTKGSAIDPLGLSPRSQGGGGGGREGVGGASLYASHKVILGKAPQLRLQPSVPPSSPPRCQSRIGTDLAKWSHTILRRLWHAQNPQMCH